MTLVWEEGLSNGGSTVIDYRLSYDNNSGSDFLILENDILELQYDVVDLTEGLTYKFKLQARNTFGLSAYTEELILDIGFKPEQPVAPSTVVVANSVLVSWVAPWDNGSPITAYRITLM